VPGLVGQVIYENFWELIRELFSTCDPVQQLPRLFEHFLDAGPDQGDVDDVFLYGGDFVFRTPPELRGFWLTIDDGCDELLIVVQHVEHGVLSKSEYFIMYFDGSPAETS
jgi:hypothetical protein